jgi:tetratricopeptide (TPR) repeat protein
MAEKSLNEVPRPLREQYEKGLAAVQRNNLDYAMALLAGVLQKEPAFYDCREALRKAQLKKQGAASGFFGKVLGNASNSPQLAKAQLVARSNPLEALAVLESILNSDPDNLTAHRLLADAALAAELPRTAVLSLEIARGLSPRDRAVNLQLAEAYVRAGQAAKGDAIYLEWLRANPHDADVMMAYKNHSAKRTLAEQGYDALAGGQGSYRDVLKDKQEAVTLEQEHRSEKAEDVLANLIRENEARLAKEPGDVKALRELADLHRQRKDYTRALDFYQRIIDHQGAIDSSLEKAIYDTVLRRYDQLIEEVDPHAPDFAEQRARLETERAAYMLSDCQRRAEKYPTDLLIRFELGELYFQAGRLADAIKEFQASKNNAHKRIASLNYLGLCFAQRGMNDMAARTFQEAIKEKPVFDAEKKELIYNFGCVLEKTGRAAEAIKQFEEIYQEDIGYRDVGAKVDAYYAGR